MADLNFGRDIEIDPEALDVECLRQPTIYYRYSEREAETKRELAEAHEEVKVIRSELIREASGDKTIKNATQIEAFYRDHPRHKEAKERFIEAQYQANMASSAVWAMKQRKEVLEDLIRLAMSDYFARPHEPRDIAAEYENSQKEREENSNQSKKRTASRMRRNR